MHTSVLVLVSRLYMYCKIVKLGVYVYHTRDMWMGPNRRCETGFFFFFSNGTYCFPFIFCAIYLLVNADHLHFSFLFCIFVAK